MSRIVIGGTVDVRAFPLACLIADHLKLLLPEFQYERIEKSSSDWKPWLRSINMRWNWNHLKIPIIWKELLHTGSKPVYIGTLSEFLEYCNSYYGFNIYIKNDSFLNIESNEKQYAKNLELFANDNKFYIDNMIKKKKLNILISGAANHVTPYLLSHIIDIMMQGGKSYIKYITLTDLESHNSFLQMIVQDCYFVGLQRNTSVRIKRKIVPAIMDADVLIPLNFSPYQENIKTTDWLAQNYESMLFLAEAINLSLNKNLKILFPNLGPACFNATMLMTMLKQIPRENIVVATSDLGLTVVKSASEVADIPVNKIFGPPIWGYTGISHLIDIRTTYHKYYCFQPYSRYTRVRNSTLKQGTVKTELRLLEYLFMDDSCLWKRVLERSESEKQFLYDNPMKHAIAVTNVLKEWCLEKTPNNTISLGIYCNGYFALDFDGYFSMPSRLNDDGMWIADEKYPLPRDPYVKLQSLIDSAKRINVEIPLYYDEMLLRYGTDSGYTYEKVIGEDGYQNLIVIGRNLKSADFISVDKDSSMWSHGKSKSFLSDDTDGCVLPVKFFKS